MKTMKTAPTTEHAIRNIATLIHTNADRFPDRTVFQEITEKGFTGVTWKELLRNVRNIAANLRHHGFNRGDKMVIFSPNRLEMLEIELAVMASGGVAVPIFAFFKKDTADLLIRHSDASFLAVAGPEQLKNLSYHPTLKAVFVFDDTRSEHVHALIPFSKLLAHNPAPYLLQDVLPEEICLNMYTSGTMGTPKCVQLTHQNILSQRIALEQIWNIDENDRFLSYLPWHHSFGGIFELFTAMYHGATITLESGYGKDIGKIIENWARVQPTVFFSVPKIYEGLMAWWKSDEEAEKTFFHPELKFVFTAAAALPDKISREFERRNIPVYEGWGLTETSPCCTITDPSIPRMPGVVGFPIPGVNLRLADDGEIQVNGPNVMAGYYNNPEANRDAFTQDGWFRTGDIGESTASGLKLLSRKDRIFKLTNGEKVIPTEMEMLIQGNCHYISYALVEGSGRDYSVALLFPNKKMLDNPDYHLSPMDGCYCPRSIEELGKCLQGCLMDANCDVQQKFSRIKSAIIIDDELSIENNTLTPSMKMAPKNVLGIYKAHLERLYSADNPSDEEVYVIQLDQPVK